MTRRRSSTKWTCSPAGCVAGTSLRRLLRCVGVRYGWATSRGRTGNVASIQVTESKRCVVFTGAGISTSCGIPDFRGPQGVWTLQRAGKPLPRLKTSFGVAKPSLTHQALVGLVQASKVGFIVSQNVDGLHLRSGVPRNRLAELHGNCFAERCCRCRAEFVRDFEMETVRGLSDEWMRI